MMPFCQEYVLTTSQLCFTFKTKKWWHFLWKSNHNSIWTPQSDELLTGSDDLSTVSDDLFVVIQIIAGSDYCWKKYDNSLIITKFSQKLDIYERKKPVVFQRSMSKFKVKKSHVFVCPYYNVIIYHVSPYHHSII